MTNLINMNNNPTISSYDFLKDFINPCRVEAGKAEMENRKFNKKIEEEFGEGIKAGKKVRSVCSEGNGGYRGAVVVYDLTEDQCIAYTLKTLRKLPRSSLNNRQKERHTQVNEYALL